MTWPDTPEELLDGPRGRRLCFELVSPWWEDCQVRATPAWRDLKFGSTEARPPQLAAELAVLVAAADLTAAAAEETSLLEPLRSSVDAAKYWQPPEELDQALAEPAVAEALGPVARAVTAWSAAAWWGNPLARDKQQFVEALDPEWARSAPDGGPALSGAADELAAWRDSTLEDERGAAARPADPAAPYSGYWWSSPVHSRLVATTRALPGLPAVRLELVEDGAGWRDVACWHLVPAPEARVYEIRRPEDWARLAARYPLDVSKSRRHDWWKVTGMAGAWFIPDYVAVASDYDAVHLTVAGYLTTAGRALPLDELTAGGTVARTMLAGWNPDETYWLADVLTTAGPPVRWVKPDREAPLWEGAS